MRSIFIKLLYTLIQSNVRGNKYSGKSLVFNLQYIWTHYTYIIYINLIKYTRTVEIFNIRYAFALR